MATPKAGEQLSADVWETPGGEAYELEIPLPGIRPDEITVEVMACTVMVSTVPHAALAEPGRKYLQREHEPRPSSRIFELPMELDTDGMRASLEYGVLKIHAPIALAGRRKIIRVAQAV
jgi:HSP20 family molecular chaperone IbpA